MRWKMNTSNAGKIQEYSDLFAQQGLELTFTHIDLREIVADAVTVAAHKASHVDEFILIEDTSLDIENEDVGINIKWLLIHLDQFLGKRAVWTTYLAYRDKNKIYMYKGEVKGIIVSPRGDKGFGFDRYFLPDTSKYTLAEDKPDQINARAHAVKALIKKQSFAVVEAIHDWQGSWQQE